MVENLVFFMVNLCMFSFGGMIVFFGEFFIDFVLIVVGVLLVDVLVFKKVFGGVFVNVVVGVSRFGGCLVFIGKVGDDEFGCMLVDVLEKNGVNVKGLCFDIVVCIVFVFVVLKECGEWEFMFF